MTDFALVGDLSAVDRLAASIAQLGQRRFLRGMLGEMGDAALGFVQEEFAGSHDADGNRWAPLKRPRRGGPVLDKTGELKGGVRKRLTPDGFALYTLTKYGPFHQHGTRNMVARPFFPVGPPPPAWLTKFDAIAEAHVRRLIGRAA